MKRTFELNEGLFQDFVNLATGLFAPLEGFMTRRDRASVVSDMTLADGSIWTIPIDLDVDAETFSRCQSGGRLDLAYQGKVVGFMDVSDCYEVDVAGDAARVFKTAEEAHPGVKRELERHQYRVGGKVNVADPSVTCSALSPIKTRELFANRNWKTVVGFHTRNPIHRAHEHLQRVGLEVCDGLFLNPILGWRKDGDFTEEAILKSYRVMIDKYYPPDRVWLDGLRTSVRYAGPREAVFHAMIRRNLGCTHFIIGRDHAGVGSYYGTYEAQELAMEIAKRKDLGIQLLLLHEPYYCLKCDEMVSDKHCGHDGGNILKISGTDVRAMLKGDMRPDNRFLRPEVADVLIGLGRRAFVGDC